MKTKCDNCHKTIYKKPSAIKNKNFCNKTCRSKYHNVKVSCFECGKEFVRNKNQISETNFCGLKCSRKWLSKRMSEMNEDLNPERMTLETRLNVRKTRIKNRKSKPKSYLKFLGKHVHRIEAEKKIGRKLKPGEVVHHLDGDKQNNNFNNLEVLKNQAEHAKIHYVNGRFKTT